MAKNYQTMSCSEIMVRTKAAVEDTEAFVETSRAHTIRTIEHLLKEQRAEVALVPCLNLEKGKFSFVSSSLAAMRRNVQLQLNPILLLPSDHPLKLRYLTHSYYIFTLERILI